MVSFTNPDQTSFFPSYPVSHYQQQLAGFAKNSLKGVENVSSEEQGYS